MSIVINGSGTVTGLAVGGLPDGTVDAGTLATDSVEAAKLADNAVGLAEMASGTDGNIISYDASGNPVAIATGSDGQVLTSTGAGSPPAFEAIPAGGITEADQHRLTTNLQSPNDGVSTLTNWERPDTDNFGKLGTGVSQSSGAFTFPSTGYWLIDFYTTFSSNQDARYCQTRIETTSNNSTWNLASLQYSSINPESSYWYQTGHAGFIFDCENVSTHKARFQAGGIVNDVSIMGASDINYTFANFIRLGDT
jgi:hypothetical protein